MMCNHVNEFAELSLRRNSVKTQMINSRLTNRWMTMQVNSMGIKCDERDLSKALNGIREGKKEQNIIAACEAVMSVYRSAFVL